MVINMKKVIIALDLHGTLLDVNWKITTGNRELLLGLLNDMSPYVDFYICTGNDYSFVEKYVDKDILNLIHGFVLESGCLAYKSSQKTVLTDESTTRKTKELEEYLKSLKLPFIKYFAKREASISIFTCDESGGEVPAKFYEIIKYELDHHEYKDDFCVTWSNVAIDIIPTGYSKWNTLKKHAEDKTIISFMDSFNDKEIALYSDYCILPANSSEELIFYLRNNNRLIFPLKQSHFIKNHGYIASTKYTDAVIEGLNYLKPNIVGVRLATPNQENK